MSEDTTGQSGSKSGPESSSEAKPEQNTEAEAKPESSAEAKPEPSAEAKPSSDQQPEPDAQRDYDIVVFGATGFTGQLIAEYLAENGGASLRWALAGRTLSKLERTKSDLQARYPSCPEPGLITADLGDWATLVFMAQQTKVVLTTVGPYVNGGDRVVHACIVGGADYVDITGEPQFVTKVREVYDDQARERGVRIVNCCGFDSIPPDIGVLYTVQQLPEDVPLIIEGFVRANGSFSGGTWRSAITGFGRMRELRERRAAEQQPATHQAPGDRSVYPLKQRLHYQRQLRGWGFPLPTIDAYIVRRSARAIPRYGPSFGYAHYGLSRSLPKIIGGGLGLGALVVLAQFGPTRNFLLDRVDSGDGPSAEKRAKSWFELTFVGRSKNGTSSVITKVSGGDPGYGETAKMASESALCLAFDRDKLPDAAGILTPAVAMGNALLERLQTAGIRFEVVERST